MPIDDIHEATEILKELANRIDPYTGKIYPANSPYESTQLASALYIVLEFVGEYLPKTARSKRRRQERLRRAKRLRRLKVERPTPEMAGKAWGEEESKLLIERFDAGMPIAEIAKLHQRTQTAIESRLLRLNRVSSRDEARTGIRHKE